MDCAASASPHVRLPNSKDVKDPKARGKPPNVKARRQAGCVLPLSISPAAFARAFRRAATFGNPGTGRKTRAFLKSTPLENRCYALERIRVTGHAEKSGQSIKAGAPGRDPLGQRRNPT